MNATKVKEILQNLYDMYGWTDSAKIEQHYRSTLNEFQKVSFSEYELEGAISQMLTAPPAYMPNTARLLKEAFEFSRTHQTQKTIKYSDGLEWYRKHCKIQYEREVMVNAGMIKYYRDYESRKSRILPDEQRIIRDFWMTKRIVYHGEMKPLLTESEIKNFIDLGLVTPYVPEDARNRWAIDLELHMFPTNRNKPVPRIEDYYDSSKTNPNKK